MKRSLNLLMALFLLGHFSYPTFGQGAIHKNPLAESIIGDWDHHDKVQDLLGDTPISKSDRMNLSFRKDERSWDKVPPGTRDQALEYFKAKGIDVRLTGWLKTTRPIGSVERPVFLFVYDGMPRILFAQDEGDVRFGRLGHFYLAFAKGETPDRDILFITPRPSDAYTAFRRVANKKPEQ